MHSAPFSEIAAHACGLAAGLLAYKMSGGVIQDPRLRLHVAMTTSVICNAIVGGKINLLMHDFMSLLIVRPISGYLGAKLLEYVVSHMK